MRDVVRTHNISGAPISVTTFPDSFWRLRLEHLLAAWPEVSGQLKSARHIFAVYGLRRDTDTDSRETGTG